MATSVRKFGNRGFVSNVVEKLYGYDVFISYTRLDDPNSTFALAIHTLLTQGDAAKKRKPMRCFLDTREIIQRLIKAAADRMGSVADFQTFCLPTLTRPAAVSSR